ncbi:hypothetical protein B0H10DRAFT_2439315 [Mycena sp. CBHHK59/15]|nr:hypothetical protein B0H10DRAFT_2439315 [Mycena sp. CBHHK59/15]
MSKNPGSNLSPVERIGSPPTVPNSLAEPLVETTGNNAINLAAWWYIRLDDGGDLQLVPHIDDVGTIYRHSIRVIGDIGLDQMKRRVDKIGETDHPPKKLKPETVVIEFRDHSWVMLLHNQKDEFGFSNPVGNPAVTTYKRPRRGGSSTTDSAELRQGGNDIGSLQDNLTSELAHHPEREPPGASSTADSAELRLQGNDIGRVQDNSTSELVHHPELEVSSRTVSAERVGIQMSGSPSSNLSPVERIGSPLDVLKSVAGPFVDTTGDNAPESAALWWYRRLKMTFAHNLMLDPEPETLGFMRAIRVVGNIRMEEIHRWVADIANLSDRPERPVAVRIVGNGYTILIYHGENGHIRVSSRAHYPEPEASSTAVLAERRQCEDLGGVQNASAAEPPRPNYPNSSVPRPEHGGGFNHQHGGGPPGPWLGLPPNPPPPAFPNISWPNVPHPGGGFPWNCATPGAGLVPQMPRVSPPARRIVQLPFNAADQWESIYSPQKHAQPPP